MNLSDIRDRVFSQVDWAPTQSVDAIARVDAFINRAYYQLAIDAPFLFFQDQLLLATQADVVPQAVYTAPTDTVAVRPDPWVLRRSISNVAAGVVLCLHSQGDLHLVSSSRQDVGKLLQLAHRFCTRWVRLDI